MTGNDEVLLIIAGIVFGVVAWVWLKIYEVVETRRWIKAYEARIKLDAEREIEHQRRIDERLADDTKYSLELQRAREAERALQMQIWRKETEAHIAQSAIEERAREAREALELKRVLDAQRALEESK